MLLMSLVERTEHLLSGRQVVGMSIREVSRTVELRWGSRPPDSAVGHQMEPQDIPQKGNLNPKGTISK